MADGASDGIAFAVSYFHWCEYILVRRQLAINSVIPAADSTHTEHILNFHFNPSNYRIHDETNFCACVHVCGNLLRGQWSGKTSNWHQETRRRLYDENAQRRFSSHPLHGKRGRKFDEHVMQSTKSNIDSIDGYVGHTRRWLSIRQQHST